VAPPFRTAEFDMLFVGRRMGISREGDMLDLGVELNIVKKLGAFYSFGELRLGQGRENARAFLLDNPTLATEIEALIRDAAAATPLAMAPASKAKAQDEEEDEDVEEGAEA
jgi:recombination protein RecA